MDQKKKLTIRVKQRWIENAKSYAQHHNTTVTQLVSDFLRQLGVGESISRQPPVLHRLSGILPEDVSIEEHRDHLVDKYGG